MSVSIVIPVARYPWFVDAVLENYRDTEVDLDDPYVELVFLTSQTVTEPLEMRLSRGDGFRWLKAPFNQNNNHLPLLDWAMRNDPQLREWVILQHCDCFHRERGWLPYLKSKLKNTVALQSPRGPRYRVGGRMIQVQHDYLGCVYRPWIVEHDLRFNWGKVCDLNVSPEVMAKIDAGKLKGVTRDTWLDGSHLVGLELGIRWPELVRPFNWPEHLHIWQFFKWGNRIKRVGDVIQIESRPQCPFPLLAYSVISSLYWPKGDDVLPWALLSQYETEIERDTYHADVKRLEWLGQAWERSDVSCGLDDSMGLRIEWLGTDDSIRFTDD